MHTNFNFWIRYWSHIATHSCRGNLFQKSLRLNPFKSDCNDIWQICYRSEQWRINWQNQISDSVILSRWRPWRHFAKTLQPITCEVTGSLYALQYLIIVHLYLFNQPIFQTYSMLGPIGGATLFTCHMPTTNPQRKSTEGKAQSLPIHRGQYYITTLTMHLT